MENQINPLHSPASVSDSLAEEEKEAEKAQRALLNRPKISIRLRITLSFLILFLLLSGLAVAFLIFVSRFNTKQTFLEKTANYTFEIQQARRFEKNFFLYGTNLDDAMLNVQAAHNILNINQENLISVIGKSGYERMEESLSNYGENLNVLQNLKRTSNSGNDPQIIELENQLRRYGSEIVTSASSLIDQERIEIQKLVSIANVGIVLLLIFFLISIAYIIHLLTRQILRPINRAVKYTERVAAGDFTLIKPMRKYRDEFSTLSMAINRMIHEIRVRQEQLTQSRKMAAMGNLTAGIAHELNNPLNNISLTTETLLDEYKSYNDAEKKKMLMDIFTQVERASSTVRNLLDFTRVEKPSFASLFISDLIDSTVNLLRNEMTLSDIDLKLNIQKNLPPVIGNSQNLQQVFLNLILNAIQAMPDGGNIKINVAMDADEFIRVDVVDSGIGIPKENQDKIFDPFFTTKEVGKGTGLGLSVSYGIIESHGGKITVKSHVGQGTTFSVFLPIQSNSKQ